jgi:hypothetical protein
MAGGRTRATRWPPLRVRVRWPRSWPRSVPLARASSSTRSPWCSSSRIAAAARSRAGPVSVSAAASSAGDRGERQPACPGGPFHHHDPTPGQGEELDPAPVAAVEAVDRLTVEDVVAYRREVSGVVVGCDGRDVGRAQWDQRDVGPPCCLSYPDPPVSPVPRGTTTLTPQVTYLIERTGRSLPLAPTRVRTAISRHDALRNCAASGPQRVGCPTPGDREARW